MTIPAKHTTPIPNPGPDRDGEIAKLLGRDRVESIAIDLDLPEGATARFSSERTACDALVAAMGLIGFEVHEARQGFPPHERGTVDAHFSRAARDGGAFARATGRDHCDAVSGAALVALREWR